MPLAAGEVDAVVGILAVEADAERRETDAVSLLSVPLRLLDLADHAGVHRRPPLRKQRHSVASASELLGNKTGTVMRVPYSDYRRTHGAGQERRQGKVTFRRPPLHAADAAVFPRRLSPRPAFAAYIRVSAMA